MAPELEQTYAHHLETLARSYADALAEHRFDALVIDGGVATIKSRFDDDYWPLRPTPAFAHWLPLSEGEATLVIVPGERPRLLRAAVASFWDSPVEPESGHFWAHFEVISIAPDAISEHLPRGKVAFIANDPARAAAVGAAAEATNPPALLASLDQIRAVKTAYELTCLGEANRRAALGHQRLCERFLAEDASELELHLTYLQATSQDAYETPYRNIVARGAHAGVLHHLAYARQPARRTDDSLLVDAGASYLGYASDITRTWVKGNSADARRFAALIDAVTAAQQRLCSELAPGLAYEELHERAHGYLGEILRDMEIAEATAEELVARGVTRTFFPHGLGHSLGLQVHDVGCRLKAPRAQNRFLRTTSVVEAGNVFTIEPGCYFIPSLLDELRASAASSLIRWELVDRLVPFGGVRIEDNVAVTDSGNINLTRDNWPAQP